jgi:para-aminobenzoate synthetase component 1
MSVFNTTQDAIRQMNQLGSDHIPFVFLIDFEQHHPEIWSWEAIKSNTVDIDFQFPGFQTIPPVSFSCRKKIMPFVPRSANRSEPINEWIVSQGYSFSTYLDQFNHVVSQLKKGNSFLVNLTCEVPIETVFTLQELYDMACAKYKLRYKDAFICFSPETFVRIREGLISSCPMKGTIEANMPKAGYQLLNDRKEKAEHSTIVDLIRNDLSILAEHVKVQKFRYLEKISTDRHALLQTSSLISGSLPADYPSRIGDIIFSLLPAGSISGAPKPSTIRIIHQVETYKRGYYTGVFGIFDGTTLDSAVLIRFIERKDHCYVYKTGGGITALSQPEKEYEEMLSKIYVPIH